jgi:hypothetical protein
MKDKIDIYPPSSGRAGQSFMTISNWTMRSRKRRFTLLALIALYLVFKLFKSNTSDSSTFRSVLYTGGNNTHAPSPEPPFSAKLPDGSEKQNPVGGSDSPLSESPKSSTFKPPKPVEEERNTTLAITTTVLKPGPTFTTWLDYHLRRFDLIIVFMDDPNERQKLERLVSGKPVVLLEGSAEAPEMKPATRLLVRQDTNNAAAIAYALTQNITWLLHIDIDELFFEDGDRSWANREDVGNFRFDNHEAVPSSRNITDFFEECTLFWINGKKTFMAYDNGKSAVRLSPEVVPMGPHRFGKFKGDDVTVKQPMILHYSTPTFESWVAKYKFYGDFPDYWEDDHTTNALTFMLESRDHVQKALATGNWEEARKFYDSLIPDAETRHTLFESGVLRQYMPFADIPKHEISKPH